MKNTSLLLIVLIFALNSFAQIPEKMSYQAVIRNNSNQLVVNHSIGMQVTILKTSVNGTAVFIERHFSTSNANGLVSLEIGSGTLVSGSFNNIDWSEGPYFIKTETDLNGGVNYTITGTNQLLSVPYAMYAKFAQEDMTEDSDADPANEIQTLSLDGTQLTLSKNGNTITLPSSGGGDNLGNHSAQQNILTNNNWLSNDGGNEGVFIREDGRVGIGTNNPETLLQIGNSSHAYSALNIRGARQNQHDASTLSFGDELEGYRYKMSLRGTSNNENANFTLVYRAGDPYNYLTALGVYPESLNSTNYALALHNDDFYISETGNVGVGTLSPLSKIEVAGVIHTTQGGFKFPDGTVQATAAVSSGGSTADNWGTQVVEHNSTLTGDGTTSNPLEVVQGQLNPDWANIQAMPAGFSDDTDNIEDADADSTNEIQSISITGTQISLSKGGGTVNIPEGAGVWTKNGDIIYYNDGNVGIGISNPLSKLSVGTQGVSKAAIYGSSYLTNGIGVYGKATANSINQFIINYGGYFEAAGNYGSGVYGEGNTGIIGKGTSSGISGLTENNIGVAVRGKASSTQGTNYGGHFTSDGRTGTGVFGLASSIEDAINYGGYFKANGKGGIGVFGHAANKEEEDDNYGGYFISDAKRGIGVFGNATETGAYRNYGGVFHASGEAGVGVQGNAPLIGGEFIATDESGMRYGVVGKTYTGCGVMGEVDGPISTGVMGVSRYSSLTVGHFGVEGIALGGMGYGVIAKGALFDFYAGGKGTNYGSASSIRWKKNINPIRNPIDKIKALRGVYFDWDEEHGGKHDIGMIAEEVGKVLPEIVAYEGNGIDANGMDYSMLTPLLVEVCKALKAELDEVKAELSQLKTEIANK